MSSRLIDAQCAGKVAHATRSEATAHKKGLLRRNSKARYNVYECSRCGFYHVGHANKYASRLRERRKV